MLYRLILKLRHSLYDKGLKKSFRSEVPTICVGNITVGGTGKTPHTEMILRLLLESEEWGGKHIAVLSRGYKRKSRGFQVVSADGSADMYGDEALQIKKKFPSVTVAVDKDRIEGCHYLCHPEQASRNKAVVDADFPAADIIVLDDAFQYRRLKADRNIILVNWNRPLNTDKLLPFGRLRDLPSRISEADAIIVTKCPAEPEESEMAEFVRGLGLRDWSPSACTAVNGDGKVQRLFFSTIDYCKKEGVFSTTDPRYIYSKKLLLVTGIAGDTGLRNYLSDDYSIIRRFNYPDHHRFRSSDINNILNAVKKEPLCAIATTEKDVQRILDYKEMPQTIMARMFYVPIKVSFLSLAEREQFADFLTESAKRS